MDDLDNVTICYPGFRGLRANHVPAPREAIDPPLSKLRIRLAYITAEILSRRLAAACLSYEGTKADKGDLAVYLALIGTHIGAKFGEIGEIWGKLTY